MKRIKELEDAVIDLIRLASEKDIEIEEISIGSAWYSTATELTPKRVMGIPVWPYGRRNRK